MLADKQPGYQPWDEVADLSARFAAQLAKPTADGKNKRARGEKPPWFRDTHEAQVFSHLAKWKRGETFDPESGAHTLVHAAWRLLAIACIESGDTPAVTVPMRGGQV